MKDPLSTLIDLALAEDVGTGDVTTTAIIDRASRGHASLRAKSSLVVSGLDMAQRVFLTVDQDLSWKPLCRDGDHVSPGTILAEIDGVLASLLTAERTALNFLQHLSGIATLTARFVAAVEGTKAKILDTRKTLPGWRQLEKQAVRHGGGINHRQGLYDRYLIKNNHITAAGSLREAIARIHRIRNPKLLLEVETQTLDDVRKAVEANVNVIMLDNMSIDHVREAVKLVHTGGARPPAPFMEVSGNITLENVRSYAETGADCISVGALTHSAPAIDIHLII